MSKEKEELKDSEEVCLVREHGGAMDLDKLMCQFRIHGARFVQGWNSVLIFYKRTY